MSNIDNKTVKSFGEEWKRFDQRGMPDDEAKARFEEYFAVFPWIDLPINAEGFDMGCGTGRWARWVAPKVSKLHCIDPSDAIEVAKINLSDHRNTNFIGKMMLHHQHLSTKYMSKWIEEKTQPPRY